MMCFMCLEVGFHFNKTWFLWKSMDFKVGSQTYLTIGFQRFLSKFRQIAFHDAFIKWLIEI